MYISVSYMDRIVARSDWFHYCVIVCAIKRTQLTLIIIFNCQINLLSKPFCFSSYNLKATSNCYHVCPVTVTGDTYKQNANWR